MERIGPEALQQDFLVWTAKGRPERDRAASSKRQKQEGPALTANQSRDISSTIRDTVVRTLGDVLESEAIKKIDRGLVPKAKKQQWKKYVAMSFFKQLAARKQDSVSGLASAFRSRTLTPAAQSFLQLDPSQAASSTDAPVPALAPMPNVVPKAGATSQSSSRHATEDCEERGGTIECPSSKLSRESRRC